MAEVERKRTLINPAKRRNKKRRNKARRNMSAKQIAIFGTKRQKAALKASRKRKRNRAKPRRNSSRRRNAAPARPRATRRAHRPKRRHRARRRNPGGIVEVALNPAPKRRKAVARTRKRRKSSARRRHNRRRNPAPVTHRRRRHRSTSRRRSTRRRVNRRNPSRAGVTSLIVSAAYAIGGAVGSKYLTEMVLGASNTGYMGYGANLAAAFVGGKLVGMFTKNRSAENSVILGGVIMTLIRFLSDQTPAGQYLKAAGLGRGFGDYEASTWLSPARYVNAAQSAQVDIPLALRPQVAAAGMSGLRGGTYSRARGTY